MLLCALGHVSGAELLTNGDFEVGRPESDKSASFNCKGWRRQLWRETAFNSWLTDGARDRQVGAGNKALEFRWGATSVYQYFSAAAGESYSFAVDCFNPGSTANRWQPRIQVAWHNAAGKQIGGIATIVEADNTTAPVRKWNKLSGSATAPAGTAYARVLLNVNNKGSGAYFQKMFLDNASVQGTLGKHNLPVSFISAPYDMTLKAIFESTPYSDSLANYADDRDGDKLCFLKLSGPAWLAVSADGTMRGTPLFADAGDNKLVVKVEDGRGSSDTRTLTIPVVGFLRLGNLFDDDMVLQQGAPIPVWGKAVANSPVRVRMSSGESAETKSDAKSDWSLVLPAMPASTGGAVTMAVSSGAREFQFSNVLVGDVWLCSGQSNMAWPLKNTDGSAAEIASANHPDLRLLRTPETRAKTPWTDLRMRARWQPCTPKTAGDFSAVAYYFGKKLEADLKIPIGLINSSQGGSSIQPWTRSLVRAGDKTFYNSRIHPYTRLPIKGAIWYQGEANVRDGSSYAAKMQTLAKDWRAAWGRGDFPFYFVQLPPFDYKGDAVYNLPELCAAQTAAMELIPNSGMAVINDLGNLGNIHPRNKAPVGERLARWALHATYGQTDLVPTGPMIKKVRREDSRLRISFSHVGSGLASRDGKALTWFQVAGADEAYVSATATIDRDTVLVTAPTVPKPEWVRFAWHETAEPNLMNAEGLPANAFAKSCE